ncbi:ribonuclease VapC [Sulfuriferula plumbiphila]|uniref:Ribonuclease VapC n=1 Tax=Sulfuriferula plumbiphila TaxID=171865 RepID=A0A512L6M0_9PROT|nr:type II toxin-antitoxin system VapC family toxin [Sulfuriferula plumbiphila]BBP04824.1 ribonuclease VapC [Sulfuriferula plumbiphila]GEP30097.1 ribonuclease VapC [Sulfuriferula plumbiphila]
MLYFDTSFLAPLLLEESTSAKIEAFFTKLPVGELYVSHWTRVEFASLVAREVRMGGLAEADALLTIGQFDELVAGSFQVLAPGVVDYELAKGYIQHFSTKLRAGDALHLAIASNNGANMLYTLDEGFLSAAKLLKVHASRGIKI